MSIRPAWDSIFMSMAFMFAMRSPDTSTRVGCVVVDDSNTVVSLGYNGRPRGIEPFALGDPRLDRPTKYLWMEHAERNAIYNACRTGTPLDDCSLYVTLFPCADCARGIVQVGIKHVIYHKDSTDLMAQASGNWDESHAASFQMFEEAGVRVTAWVGDIVIPEGFCRGEVQTFSSK